MAHAITKPVVVTPKLKNEFPYPVDVAKLEVKIATLEAAVLELQTIVAALA